MIRVVTDSSADLPVDVAHHLRIEVVPLTVRLGNRDLLDRRDLSIDAFWQELGTASTLPETAAPAVSQFQEAYLRLRAEGAVGIVTICMSSRLSAAYQAARIAGERVEKDLPVRVVDSESVSMALGFQVMEAGRAALQGDPLAAVEEAAQASVLKTGLLVALDTLQFLERGGRIGRSQALVGRLLDIKPLLSLDGGIVAPAGRVRSRAKALDALAARVQRLLPAVAELAVVHGRADDLEALLLRLAEHVSREDVLVADLGPVVGTHTGPGVIGVAFRLK